MTVDATSLFSQIIQDHLELKRRNAGLEREMPIDRYKKDDTFENHPLFKSEQQARLEETMGGQDAAPVSNGSSHVLQWHEQHVATAAPAEHESSDESLWGRSRDFDWGD